jgi:hypothetical protein
MDVYTQKCWNQTLLVVASGGLPTLIQCNSDSNSNMAGGRCLCIGVCMCVLVLVGAVVCVIMMGVCVGWLAGGCGCISSGWWVLVGVVSCGNVYVYR